MNSHTEDRLRAAFEAKAGQVTDERLDQLELQRKQLLAAGVDDIRWRRSEGMVGSVLLHDLAGAGSDEEPTPLALHHPAAGNRHARWLAPALAAAAIAAVAIAVTAITTSGNGSAPKPNPPASQISTPAPSTSAPSTTSPAPQPSGTPTATATPPAQVAALGPGQQAGRSEIPWSQIGPGWTLALWTSSTTLDEQAQSAVLRNVPESLFLVNPLGGRYLITTLPAGHNLQLEEWSGDSRRARFMRMIPNANLPTSTHVELDLDTGAWHDITVRGGADFSYTKPLGLALLVRRDSGLERVGLDGARQLLYPTSYPGVGKVRGGFYTPNGSQLVRDIDRGWVVITNDGALVRTLSMPTGMTRCYNERWWSTDTVLMSCYPGLPDGHPSLWLVPITGAAVTPLLAGPSEFFSAIRVGSQTFLEDSNVDRRSSCDGTDLAVLLPDGQTRALNFRKRTGTSQGVHVLQATARLLFLTTNLPCGQGQRILSYDTRADTFRTLLGGQVNGGSIIQALGYRATDPPR